MMDTRLQIIETANNFLVERGFNAFSYKSISEKVGVKTSSIHYYFPTKSDLGIAIIQSHRLLLEQWITKSRNKTALEKINSFFKYYKKLVADQKVCIMGALTSDINTLEEPLRQELLSFGEDIVEWVASILNEGHNDRSFKQISNPKEKAKLILSNVMGLVQIARIEKDSKTFDRMVQVILDEFILNNNSK